MQTPVMVIAAGAGLPPGIVPEVPFPPLAMTGIAIATRGRRVWELLLTAVFAAAHLSVLLGLRNATPAAASESLADFETATYLDIPPPTSVASPRRVAKPRPVGVSAAVTVPAVQEAVVRPDKAAGFQELTAPGDLQVLAATRSRRRRGGRARLHRTGSRRRRGGRKASPGHRGGPRGRLGPRRTALGRRRDGVGSAGRGRVGDRQAATAEPGRDARPAAPAVPPVAATVGVEGSAIVQFVVDTNGRVDPKSVTLVSATHPLFGFAAIEVARKARFSAGRIASGGGMVSVPVTVRAPLKWTQAKSK